MRIAGPFLRELRGTPCKSAELALSLLGSAVLTGSYSPKSCCLQLFYCPKEYSVLTLNTNPYCVESDLIPHDYVGKEGLIVLVADFSFLIDLI